MFVLTRCLAYLFFQRKELQVPWNASDWEGLCRGSHPYCLVCKHGIRTVHQAGCTSILDQAAGQDSPYGTFAS
jgi:hypothetical protein